MNLRVNKDEKVEEGKSSFKEYTEARLEAYNTINSVVFSGVLPDAEKQLKVSYEFEKDYIQMKARIEEVLNRSISWWEMDDIFIMIMSRLRATNTTERLELFYRTLGISNASLHINFMINMEINNVKNQINHGMDIVSELTKKLQPVEKPNGSESKSS